jgi:hypothetical protein
VLNTGAEYFAFMMQHYFDGKIQKAMDIKSLIEKLKKME